MMQLSGALGFVETDQWPGERYRRWPWKAVGSIRRGLYELRAATASGGSWVGGERGCWRHQASPASASASVELDAGERSKPEKKEGGGGKREVSGIRDSQSCLGLEFEGTGGGLGGGAV